MLERRSEQQSDHRRKADTSAGWTIRRITCSQTRPTRLAAPFGSNNVKNEKTGTRNDPDAILAGTVSSNSMDFTTADANNGLAHRSERLLESCDVEDLRDAYNLDPERWAEGYPPTVWRSRVCTCCVHWGRGDAADRRLAQTNHARWAA